MNHFINGPKKQRQIFFMKTLEIQNFFSLEEKKQPKPEKKINKTIFTSSPRETQ